MEYIVDIRVPSVGWTGWVQVNTSDEPTARRLARLQVAQKVSGVSYGEVRAVRVDALDHWLRDFGDMYSEDLVVLAPGEANIIDLGD